MFIHVDPVIPTSLLTLIPIIPTIMVILQKSKSLNIF
jgi:hypothetical protein